MVERRKLLQPALLVLELPPRPGRARRLVGLADLLRIRVRATELAPGVRPLLPLPPLHEFDNGVDGLITLQRRAAGLHWRGGRLG